MTGARASDIVTLPGAPPVQVMLRRSAQARRLSLRVSRLDGKVTLTVPKAASRGPALAFLRSRETWIRDTLAAMPESVAVRPGIALPVEGVPLKLTAAATLRVHRDGDRLIVPQPRAAGPQVAAYLRGQARARLSEACARHAATLGLGHGRITIRDTRSRWGSCSAAGNLNFSWRLIMAPPEILDYVAAHEVAHLARMDHSPAFWAHVARLRPDHAQQRAWLRREGHLLHRWRFGD